jgi:hypothetical protein
VSGAVCVAIVALLCYVVLRAIRDAHHDNRRARQHSSFLAHHERDRRRRQLDREAWESEQIGWRR